jgi:hypothetical protein
MLIPVAAQVKAAVLSVVVLRVADLGKVDKAAKVGRAAKGKGKVRTAIRAKKYIMASLLLLQPAPKVLEMGPKGMHPKGENPSIKGLESLVILAKASDF